MGGDELYRLLVFCLPVGFTACLACGWVALAIGAIFETFRDASGM